MHSIAKTLLFLLPLTAVPLALAQDASKTTSAAPEETNESGGFKEKIGDAADNVGNFFKGGPLKIAAKFPPCILDCYDKVLVNTECKSDPALKCPCGKDKGKSIQEQFEKCNKDSKKCTDDEMGDVQFDNMCQALDGEDDAVYKNTLVEMKAAIMAEELKGLGLSDDNIKEKLEEAKKNNTESGAAAVGNPAAGALAAVLGFAVVLL